MTMTRPRFCMTTTFSPFAALVLLTSYSDLASAQLQPACCDDRWDPEWAQRDMWGPGMMNPGQRQRMTRHWTFTHSNIPQEYLNVKSHLHKSQTRFVKVANCINRSVYAVMAHRRWEMEKSPTH
ncbi:hypothetical protein AK965_09240 [Vibrio sp. PID17_43]|nr:hypothetical protein AK965_09240 [Vibrio sp. PID17_43]